MNKEECLCAVQAYRDAVLESKRTGKPVSFEHIDVECLNLLSFELIGDDLEIGKVELKC